MNCNIVSNGQGGYEIEFNGKRYSVKWNRDDSVISGMIDAGSNLFELQTISVNGSQETIIKNVNNNETYLYRIPRLHKRFSVLTIRCHANKDRLFEPNGYGGLGGYLDDLKQPNTDENGVVDLNLIY